MIMNGCFSQRLGFWPIGFWRIGTAGFALLMAIAPSLAPIQPSRGSTVEATQHQCKADLEDAITTITDHPDFRRARWGIRVETLGTASNPPRVVYDQEGDRLFIPASNVKLLTTAAALEQLGANFRIRTSVYADNANPDGAILRLVGRGDPSLTDAALADLAQQVGDRGIRQVAELRVDDRYFASDAVNPNWEWEDVQAGYGAPVTSLILNRNELRVVAYPTTVGEPVRVEWIDTVEEAQWTIVNRAVTVPASASGFTWVGRDLSRPILYVYGQRAVGAPPDESAIAIPDPITHGQRKFYASLEAAGITVADDALTAPLLQNRPTLDNEILPPLHSQEVAHVLSPPLRELLVTANQASENIYAEALLRLVGVVGASSDENGLSPLTLGLRAVKDTLASLGIDPAGYTLADGSGLTRHNLVSPETFVDVLQVMANHPEAEVYRQSLAVIGVSGTLRYRLQGTELEGRLSGKTGGLTGISSLSGYLTPVDGDPLVISIIVNHSTQSGSDRRRAIDDIVLQLAHHTPCAVQ
jgi:D-alanyl-D-alanine carboxypeptidase/D-alanyl-D-alanine-endopeptidase (penicillin-binding protein 4)